MVNSENAMFIKFKRLGEIDNVALIDLNKIDVAREIPQMITVIQIIHAMILTITRITLLTRDFLPDDNEFFILSSLTCNQFDCNKFIYKRHYITN